MIIEKKYINKYLHLIAVDQLYDQYLNLGYDVKKEYKIGNFITDLYASKNEEKIIFEIKSSEKFDTKKIIEIKEELQKYGNYIFRLVVVYPPSENIIDLVDFESELFSEIISSDIPSELDSLSTHTRIEEISNIEISEIIFDNGINIKGIGLIGVSLQYGSDKETADEEPYIETFSFSFDLNISYYKNKYKIEEINEFEVDTSDFY